MKIDVRIRTVLQNQSVVNFALNIFNLTNKKLPFQLYPKTVNACLNKAYSNLDLSLNDKDAYQSDINSCFTLPESKFIDLLLKKRLITGTYSLDEDGYMALVVKKINKRQLTDIAKWVNNNKYIINAGYFALNKLTGEAYFKDTKTTFRPGTGYYNLLKEFLTTNKDHLTFSEIIEVQNKKLPETSQIKEEAKEHIKHLKKKLRMQGGDGKMLSMFEGKGYTLSLKQI